MSKLYKIKEAVQYVAEAIASVVGVEVTIVDNKLHRIAGTGRYAGNVSDMPIKATLFDQILQSGRGVIIDNPGQNGICLECEARQQCVEMAQVCCPIVIDEETVGVIALVAFTVEQKQTLLGQQQNLFGFLDRMADLLASKITEQERLNELEDTKKQLETVLNTVHEGIIAIDCRGFVVDLNAAAQKMLGQKAEKVIGMGVSQLFVNLSAEELLRHAKENANREISCWVSGRQLHCIMTVNVWFDSDGVKGLVATLQEMARVKKIVSRHGLDIDCSGNRILGSSIGMENVKSAVKMASRTNAAVFIRGESGTGKELFARLLHCSSERKQQPFIAVNCAAIPDNLLETELFGYEEGAFTGARRGGKPGKFELADGGTLFLDEIGDMPMQLQAKILRVLQEKRIERVGATKSLAVDVRIISATHKDIENMVKNGEFRHDLYYRINVFPVTIPPLRERKNDLPELIKDILNRYRVMYGKEINGIDEDAYELLLKYDWPGNVRELENVMEYLVSIEAGATISLKTVSHRIQCSKDASLDIMPIAQAERQLILAALAKYGTTLEGKEKVAEVLGISKATLYRKIKEYAKQSS
jgi:PAS domain S-box-containing protein